MKLIVKPHKKESNEKDKKNAPSAARSSLVTAVRRGIAQNIVPRQQRPSTRREDRTF